MFSHLDDSSLGGAGHRRYGTSPWHPGVLAKESEIVLARRELALLECELSNLDMRNPGAFEYCHSCSGLRTSKLLMGPDQSILFQLLHAVARQLFLISCSDAS
jgi:hypothetical protein